MGIVLFVWLFLTFITILFVFGAFIIEKYFDEDSSVMKWWRKHIVGVIEKDDNPE